MNNNTFLGIMMLIVVLGVTMKLVERFTTDAVEERILQRCIKHSEVRLQGEMLYCATRLDILESMKRQGRAL